MKDANISDLLGQTLTKIYQESDSLQFTTDSGNLYQMYHQQDCCENVHIEDIIGDLNDLIGSPIVEAEEVTHSGPELPMSLDSLLGNTVTIDEESATWTFYKLRTRVGAVTIRWFGSSNGYYSERVDFVKL